MFSGTSFVIGGETLIVPALSLGQLRTGINDLIREHDELAKKLGEDANDIWQEVAVKKLGIIHAALTRNYPSLTLEQVENMLDLSNVGEIYRAAMGLTPQGEGVAPGGGAETQPQPPTTTLPSSSTPSTNTTSGPSTAA